MKYNPYKELEKYSTCTKKNWDNEGTDGIKKTTINNVKTLLDNIKEFHSYIEILYATETGSLTIELYKDGIQINVDILKSSFNYFIDNTETGNFNEYEKTFNKESLNYFIKELETLLK